MDELLEAVASWPGVGLVVVVFGFAPGFCLRLIVLAYPRGDPRRAELIAELYAVPRIQRPLWVAEQLEVALFEGLGHRVSAAIRRLTGRRRARPQTDEHGAGPPERSTLGTLSILGWEPFAGSPVQIYVGFVALAGNLMVAGALPHTASP